MSWTTIESDPGVFSELISQFGAKNIKVQEVWDLSYESLRRLGRVHGLIFLFKFESGTESAREHLCYVEDDPTVFFATQVISNACATQALLHVLLNAEDAELGDVLENFKSFTLSLPPDLRGDAMNSCEEIRRAHNSFARAEPFMPEEHARDSESSEDAYHFVAYVPSGNRLMELDGLRPAPIHLDDVGEGRDWLEAAVPAIRRRIESFQSSEIRFTLLAVTADPRTDLRARLTELQQRIDGRSRDDPERARLEEEKSEAERELATEEETWAMWRKENERRQHNFVPFSVELLKILAENGQLTERIEMARKRYEEVRARARAREGHE